MVSDTFFLKINLLKVAYQTHWVHHHNHTLTTTDIVAPTLEWASYGSERSHTLQTAADLNNASAVELRGREALH